MCRCENGSWFDHVLEWWEAANADPEHVLFLTYEGMLAEPEKNFRKIADFADIPHTPEIIAKVTTVTSRSSTIISVCTGMLRPGQREVSIEIRDFISNLAINISDLVNSLCIEQSRVKRDLGDEVDI